MIKLVIVGGIFILLTGIIAVVVALRIQYRILAEKHIEREAWEHAQESHQLAWEANQRKRSLEVEHTLAGWVEQIQEERRHWVTSKNRHAAKFRHGYRA